MTGLLLCNTSANKSLIGDMAVDLFEAWSIGFLLVSAPWRMVCAERPSAPVCSKYTQAYIELLNSARQSIQCLDKYRQGTQLHCEVLSMDAATPLSFINISVKTF